MRRRITRAIEAVRVWLGWDSLLAGGAGVRVPVLAVQPARETPRTPVRTEKRRA